MMLFLRLRNYFITLCALIVVSGTSSFMYPKLWFFDFLTTHAAWFQFDFYLAQSFHYLVKDELIFKF
jgi:hypothetical protein